MESDTDSGGYQHGRISMRAALGIAFIVIAVIALLWVRARSSRSCEEHPFFTLQGTSIDCEVSAGH